MDNEGRRKRLTAGGILLGLGLGGFFDGIVLHQILQWHHMLTDHGDYPATTVAGLEMNTLWDGLFHASTYVFTVVGLALLWSALWRPNGPWSTKAFVGTMLMGWGVFNVVEGIIDHHILGIHHVNETVARDQWIFWDLAFLVWGAAMLVGGWYLKRGDRRKSSASARPRLFPTGEPPSAH